MLPNRTPEDQWEPSERILEMYRNDEWIAPVPPVCTTMWEEADWIRYIDKEGVWGPLLDEEDEECECGGHMCEDCIGEPEDCRFDTTAERDDFYREQYG